MTIAQQVLELAKRPVGVATHEVRGLTPTQVGHACLVLVRQGRLHRVRLSHRSSRFFASREDRDACVRQIQAVRVVPEHKRGVQPPVKIAPRPDAPMVIPPHVRVQVIPGYQPRFRALDEICPLLKGRRYA